MPYTAQQVNRGAGLVLAALGLSLLTQIAGLLYALIVNAPFSVYLPLLLLSCWIDWLAYRGQLWARLAFTLLSLLSGGWLLLLGFSLPQYPLALAGLLLVVSGGALWLPNVGPYFEYVQRQIDL